MNPLVLTIRLIKEVAVTLSYHVDDDTLRVIVKNAVKKTLPDFGPVDDSVIDRGTEALYTDLMEAKEER
ncbi:hypothetical protein AHIS1_p005 [Acaryochloris phage A-HIS1]|nr:hypothetical protein AHIS1_p005 [Acaryochloris phage A-HIS1]